MYPRLRELRESLGMTQEEFGKSLNIAKSTYNNYETGIRDPKSDFWVAVATKYNVTVDYLMGFSGDPHKTSESETILNLSKYEQTHIRKYRLLDPEWKEAVDGVLDIGYRKYEETQARAVALRKQREQMEAAEDIIPFVTIRQSYTQVAAAEGAGAFLLDDGYEDVTVVLNSYTQKADVILKVVGRSMEPAIRDGDRILVRIQPSINIGEIGVFILDGQGYLKERAADRLVSLNPDVADVYVGDLQQAECYGKFVSVMAPEWIVER